MGDYSDQIYSDEWRAWNDPEIPEYFNPTSVLLDKHLGTAKASATALIVDDDQYSYESFLAHVCRTANGLQLLKIGRGSRLLLFGTDSLEFLAIWFGAIRAGIVGSDVVIDSKSGISGAGRGLNLATHFSEVNENLMAYSVDGHRHMPEIIQELNGIGNSIPLRLTFLTHLV